MGGDKANSASSKQESGPGKSNKMLLLLILFLDLMGFTIIFPLVPDLLSGYLAPGALKGTDSWLLPVLDALKGILPPERQATDDLIVIVGGFLSSIYSILMFVASPWWGRLSDRVGRRPVLLLSSLGLSLSYLLWVFSDNFTLFAASRVLGGLMAGNMGVASAAMADMTPPEKRTQAMGMVGAAFGLGMLLGPMFGGLLTLIPAEGMVGLLPGLHRFSIPALFACLLSLLSALLNLSRLKETLSEENRREHPWIENPIAVARRNFREPTIALILFVNLFYLISFSAFEFGFSFFYKLDFGLEPSQIGLVFFYIGIVLVLGQGGLVRALSKRLPAKKILITGLVLMPVPMVLFAYTAPNLALSFAVLFPVIIGASLFAPGLSGLMSLHTPPDRQGLALSTLRSFGSLGRAIGPLFGAWLYWYYGVRVAYAVTAVVIFVLLLVSFVLKNPAVERLEGP